jgi:hypothetical protein
MGDTGSVVVDAIEDAIDSEVLLAVREEAALEREALKLDFDALAEKYRETA